MFLKIHLVNSFVGSPTRLLNIIDFVIGENVG